MSTISIRIRNLFATLAAMEAGNRILLEGEIWTEKDAVSGQSTGRRKVGDGTTAFNSLPFEPSAGSVTDLSIANRGVNTLDIASSTGADATVPAATASLTGLMAAADKTKLDGIAANATANATDAALRDRSTHTGTQAAGTITGLATVATSGVYDDLSGRPTLGSAAALDVGTTAGTVAAGDDARLSDPREWSASTVTQAEAEAGTATTRRAWTAQRVFQAIAAWWAASADAAKLAGIAPGATANATDAQLRDRATHTGTQAWNTITGTPTTLFDYGITDAQPLDADLTSIAGLSTTTFGRSLLTQADAAATRSTIGAAASGAVTTSGLTMSTARILGRTTASTGAVEEITVGSGLSLSGGTLTATGGGGGVSLGVAAGLAIALG